MRSEEWLDFIKYEAIRTVKLEIPFISPYRPDSYMPRSSGRQFGTGRIKEVDLRGERVECMDEWDGQHSDCLFIISTANHVVCGQDEVERLVAYINFDDDRDMSKVYKVRGKHLVTDLKSNDACEFLCMAESIDDAKAIRKLLQSNVNPDKRFSTSMFSISHPHGFAKRISFGSVLSKVTKFGGQRYRILLKACKESDDKEIQDIRKILFFYVSEILKNFPSDIGHNKLISLMRCDEYREDLVNCLNQTHLIKQVSDCEFNKMRRLLESCEMDIRQQAQEKLHSVVTENMPSKKEEEWFLMGYESDITRMEKSTVFESFQTAVLNQMKQYYNDTFQCKLNFSDRYTHVTYTVPTCPGSSGASVWQFFEENGVHKRLEAIHRGYDPKIDLNFAQYGHESVL